MTQLYFIWISIIINIIIYLLPTFSITAVWGDPFTSVVVPLKTAFILNISIPSRAPSARVWMSLHCSSSMPRPKVRVSTRDVKSLPPVVVPTAPAALPPSSVDSTTSVTDSGALVYVTQAVVVPPSMARTGVLDNAEKNIRLFNLLFGLLHVTTLNSVMY